ncbi:ComEC/Rec2 family competence protein [Luteococcus peritonei]|uniref:ComEC/Rec2 family competence protein n=1 Tax=Luteococcus peritonei TaxID=88874 RepID=A0ABW4RZD8_9ACTN
MDLRLLPLAAAGWAGAWWGTAPEVRTAAALCAVVPVVLFWGRHRGLTRRGLAAVLVCLACAASGLGREHRLDSSTVAQLARERAVVRAVVVVDGDVVLHPRRGVMPPMALVQARMVQLDGRGRRVLQQLPLTVRASGELAEALAGCAAGERIQLEGRLSQRENGRPVAALLQVRAPPLELAPPSPGARAVNALRRGLHDAMRHSPAQQAGLLPSLVVGDTAGLDESLEEDFRSTGLTHLTAVSGTNLTLTLVFLLGAARWAGLTGWPVRGLGLLGVLAFVTVCRAEPSVLRAGAMGLVALAGLGLAGGRGRGLRHLCLAVWLLVLVDPWLARSLGFALSALATGGILWWGQRWTRAMAWAPGWLAESVVVPLAAQLATQAVVTSISGEVSVVGLAANALAGPFVGPATVLGLAAMIVAPLWSGLASVLGWVAGWCVQPIIWTATTLAALPAATWRWPAQPVLVLLLGVLCLLVAPAVPWLLARRWACLLLCLVLCLACIREPRPLGWPGDWQVAFCDVGQGDATVLRAGDGQAVVVDTGPPGGDVVDCLRRLGVRGVPLLVLTHYHDDHIGSLRELLQALPVGAVLLNPMESPAAAAARTRRSAEARAIRIEMAVVGQQFRIGQVGWTTVGVGARAVLASMGEGESSQDNDSSTVGLVQVGTLRLVIGGDVEPAGQQRVVAQGWQPGVEVLKMPHHGSSRQDERFWCESGAVLAVASAGFRNDYGHPAPAALRLAQRCGMQVVRTDLGGTITVWRDGDRLEVRRQREGPP